MIVNVSSCFDFSIICGIIITMKYMITLVIGIFLLTMPSHLAQAQSFWVEPNCDPSADPTTCNVSAPLNVSSSTQTKAGSLSVQGTLTSTNAFSFTGLKSSFSVSADSITDTMVDNDLTSNAFVRNGDYSTDGEAVNLGTWTSTSSPGAEVLGTLPTSAIADDWVNEIGDTMTGELTIQPGSNRAINITQTSATATEAILLQQNATTNGIGIKIDSPSSSTTAYPIDIKVSNATRRAINIQQASVDGIGVYAYTTASTSTGIYGYANNSTGRGVVGITGTLTGSLPATYAGVYGISYTAGSPGVYGDGSSVSVGVQGATSAANISAIKGVATGANSVGVYGESSTSFGVFGNAGSSSKAYGTVGCYNKAHCGQLGGSEYAGQFDDRVVGYDFLPTQEERIGGNSFRTGEKWGNVLLSGNDFQYATFLGSDGEEVWVNYADPFNPLIHRVNASMVVENIGQSPGSVGFRGVTLDTKGYVSVRNTDGEICVWQKDAASFSCPGTPDPELQNTESLWFDGSYYWAGRTAGVGITRFDNTFALANSVMTTGTVGPASAAIVDFTQDEKYVYALEDSNTGVSPSSTKIMVIDRSGNKKTAEFIFPDWEVRALEFDGKFIWGAAITNTGDDGLVKLDPATGVYSFLNFSIKYAAKFDNPKDLVFDGTYLWVILQNSFMMTRVSPYQADPTNPTVVEDEFIQFTYAPQLITFDGEAIWVMVRDTSGIGTSSLQRIYSGKGNGYQTTTVFPREGISTWDYTTGTGSCIRLESGVLVVNTGALCN